MTDDQPFYTMSDAIALTGISAGTLKEYELCGLLNPKRSSRGIRLYSKTDIAAAKQIYASRLERKGRTGSRLKSTASC